MSDFNILVQMQNRYENENDKTTAQIAQLLLQTCPQFNELTLEPEFLRYMINNSWLEYIPQMSPWVLQAFMATYEKIQVLCQDNGNLYALLDEARQEVSDAECRLQELTEAQNG